MTTVQIPVIEVIAGVGLIGLLGGSLVGITLTAFWQRYTKLKVSKPSPETEETATPEDILKEEETAWAAKVKAVLPKPKKEVPDSISPDKRVVPGKAAAPAPKKKKDQTWI